MKYDFVDFIREFTSKISVLFLGSIPFSAILQLLQNIILKASRPRV